MHKVVLYGISENVALLVQSCMYSEINTDDTTKNVFYVVQLLSEAYTLQNNTTIYWQVISSGELVVKAQYICSMQGNTNWYWGGKPLQQTIIVPTRTILHTSLDVIIIRYVQDIPKKICNIIQAKKSIQRHPISMTDADYNYILDKVDNDEKLILKGMWLAIVTRDSTDDNNHSEIFYVVFHYRIIKYQYVNRIWIFICFYVFSLLLDSVMFILL